MCSIFFFYFSLSLELQAVWLYLIFKFTRFFCTDLDHFRGWNVNGFHLEILHSQAEWCEKKMVEKERKNIYKLSGVNGKMYWSNLHFRGNINMYRNLYALCREKWEGEASTLCHSEEGLALLTLQMKRNMVRVFWKVAQMKQSLEKQFIEPHPIGLWFIFVLVSSLATNQVSECQVNLIKRQFCSVGLYFYRL